MTDDLMQGYVRLRRRLTRDVGADDAADIAQSAFERVLRYARDVHVQSPAGLLGRIAAHLTVDHGRRRARLPVPLDEGMADMMRWDITPEREVLARQTMMQLLDAMPPRCREAFIQCELYGMTYHEAAIEMGISPDSVRQYLVEARRTCRLASL